MASDGRCQLLVNETHCYTKTDKCDSSLQYLLKRNTKDSIQVWQQLFIQVYVTMSHGVSGLCDVHW